MEGKYQPHLVGARILVTSTTVEYCNRVEKYWSTIAEYSISVDLSVQYSSKVGNTGRAWVGLGLPATGYPSQHCTIHIIWWSPRLHRTIAHYRLKVLNLRVSIF